MFVHEQVGALQLHSHSQSSTPSTSRSSSYRSDRTDQDREAGRSPNPVALRLKRSHKAETGSGEFLMFGRPRRQFRKVKVEPASENEDQPESTSRRRSALSPSPLKLVSSPQESLAAKWISVVGPASFNLYPLGSWIKFAWAHVGCDAYLDLAVDYALSAITAFRKEDQTNFIKLSAIGGRAVRSLRQAIMRGTKSVDVYVAVMLHYAAEVSRFNPTIEGTS